MVQATYSMNTLLQLKFAEGRILQLVPGVIISETLSHITSLMNRCIS